MMLGGGLMMGIGLLFLLAIIVIPILLVFALAGGAAGFLHKRNDTSVAYQTPRSTTSSSIVPSDQAGDTSARFCSHCGAGLQPGWSHCPQCGAPIS